jgi:hypothetical protein
MLKLCSKSHNHPSVVPVGHGDAAFAASKGLSAGWNYGTGYGLTGGLIPTNAGLQALRGIITANGEGIGNNPLCACGQVLG